MKQLVCEMCGSTDLVKDNGLFICQSCGCKYTVEEAKKMMIEGTVDVSGSTIKIDNAHKLENLRQLAERAKEENDSKTAAKYFEQILVEDPDDWEANFYTIFYAAHDIKIAEIGSAATRVSNIIEPVFRLIKRQVTDEEQQYCAYMEVATKVLKFYSLLLDNTREIAKHPTSKEYKEISGYIARIEHFCVGVNMKIYDRETVYQLAHGYLDGNGILDRINPIIARKNRNADTDYYENIHRVLNWMKQKSGKS